MQSATFTYSAIFATAAVIDGKIKRDRRLRLDAEIEHAKAELREREDGREGLRSFEGSEHVESTHSEDKDTQAAASTWDLPSDEELAIGIREDEAIVLGKDESTLSAMEHWAEDVFPEVDEKIQDWNDGETYPLGSRERRPHWPANTGPELKPKRLPPQSLWSTDESRRAASRKRWTPKKIRLHELCTQRMVLKMLTRAGLYDLPVTTLKDLPSTVRPFASKPLDELKEDIALLKREIFRIYTEDGAFTPIEREAFAVPTPRYQQDFEGYFHRTGADMNEAITSLFRKHASTHSQGHSIDFPDLIVKLSHNLMISSAPQNLETHNLLLHFFTRLRRAAFVDCTLQNILQSYVRPNEYTCATVLRHFTERNDAKSFGKFVALMRGLNGGLMLAHPKVDINADSGGRLIRKEGRPEKIIQKVYPTPMVYNALLAGILKFAGFERAIEICTQLNKDGWGLDIASLSNFLSHAVYLKDWSAGLWVWEQIGQLAEKERKLSASFKLDEKAYVSILKLCASCDKKTHFRLIFADAVGVGYEWSRLSYSVLGKKTESDKKEYAKTKQMDSPVDGSRQEEALGELEDEMVNESNADSRHATEADRPTPDRGVAPQYQLVEPESSLVPFPGK